MKRDMELVRGILIACRDSEKSLSSNEIHSTLDKLFPDGPKWPKQIFYHVKIMKEAGLIDANLIPYGNNGGTFTNMELTWDGQEFLDNVNDPAIWEKIKQKAGETGFAVLKQVASKLAIEMIMC